MKKRFLNKLKNCGGETLVETLFAILIATFASVLLASATATAIELNRQARERDKVTQECLKVLATDASDSTSGSLKVQLMKVDSGTGELVNQTDGEGKSMVDSVSVNYIGCTIEGYGFGDFSTYQLRVNSVES